MITKKATNSASFICGNNKIKLTFHKQTNEKAPIPLPNRVLQVLLEDNTYKAHSAELICNRHSILVIHYPIVKMQLFSESERK